MAAAANQTHPVTANAFQPPMSLDALRLLVIAIFLAKLAFALLVPPNGDEAYYFLWGQHLQWSYRDHAPMVGWGEGLGARLFGWTPLGLRFPTFLTMAGTIFLFRLWARKFAPENEKLYFWTLLGVAFASPMFNFTSTNVFPDHLLVFFVLAALYVLADFMSRRAADANASPAGLYLGAVFLGLAGLSKYSAIFFGLAFVAALLSQKRLRGLFLSPHLYLAGLLAALIVSPIFVWNATHDFASLQLHRQERFADAATPSGFTWMGIPQEIGALLFFSPFLLPAVYLFLTAPAEQGERAQIQTLGRWSFLFSSGFMLALACWGPASKDVKAYWSDLSFVSFLAVAPFFCASQRLFRAHMILGALAIIGAAALYGLNPLPTHLVGRPPFEGSRYGQPEAAAAAVAAKRKYGADFISTAHWVTLSQLAVGMGAAGFDANSDIASISPERDQFSYWRDRAELIGKTAILVGQDGKDASVRGAPFRSIEKIDSVEAKRFGLPVNRYNLYLAKDFRGPPQ